MRVDNGLTNTIATGNGLGSIGQAGLGSRNTNVGSDDHSFDNVSLSSATSLVSTARTAESIDRQSKVVTLTAQIRSGSYGFDSQAVSQSLIQSLK
jgi:anti-sigma28 factor (negative regulator of flagellin synthesis)